jgi:hypothetical protein
VTAADDSYPARYRRDEPGSGPTAPAAAPTPLAQAIGGWHGFVDGSVPGIVFVAVNWWQGLRLGVIAAVVAGAVLLGVRLLRREQVQQAVSGFIGIAVAAYLVHRTGQARNYFLVGNLATTGYAVALAISALVRWPAVGLLVAALDPEYAGWRQRRHLYRAIRLATWLWVAELGLKSVVLWSLWAAGSVGGLALVRVVFGFPLTLALLAITVWLVRRGARREASAALAAEARARGAAGADSAAGDTPVASRGAGRAE